MARLRSNRDLYQFVAALAEPAEVRPLEEYLRALWALVREHREEAALDLDTFAGLLSRALTAEAPPYDGGWQGAAAWEQTLLGQIADLRAMADSGTLDDEQRQFGVDAPGGGRWYNFDVGTYLECGVQGAFGGWDPDDAPVALQRIGWDDFESFLACGQFYE
jgi:hypothetical protein